METTKNRIIFDNEAYNIVSINHMNFKKKLLKFKCEKVRAMGTKIDNLAKEIMEGLKEYADLATDDVKKAVRKAGNSVRKDISESAPKDTGSNFIRNTN